LSKTTAEEIVSLTQSEIGLYIFTRDARRVIDGVALSYMSSQPLAAKLSDYFAQNPAAWVDIVESDLDEFRTVLMVEGQRQHSVIRRVNSRDGNTLGFAVAMRSEVELIEPFSEIQQRVLFTGVIGLLVASVLALIMALGLSRPIIRLVELTKRIEQGDYPDDTALKVTRDEVGTLQKALLQMGNGLREKAELETYLADIANDLDDVAVALPEGTLGGDVSEIHASADKTNSAGDKTLVTVTPGQKRPPATGVIDKRYKLLKSLGSGALGSVYLAHDLELDEKIALKLLARDVFDKMPGFNLKEEIRLARRVTHRNIVRTFDFGLFGDQYYITMEYVPGIDLGQLIGRTGAVTPHIGVGIAKQICAAMMAAHEMGIIHRDLKPANMMINRRGILQIMDFGLAMQVKSPADGKASTAQKKQQRNLIMGTPRFMAPEQFLGVMSLDERTDIYAIGIIMFTLFNAVPPFSGTDINDLAKKHFKAKVPNFLERSGPIPESLKNIVYRALAKKPADRFQSVRDMLDALNKL
jgi:serine/threonine-protein kinase